MVPRPGQRTWGCSNRGGLALIRRGIRPRGFVRTKRERGEEFDRLMLENAPRGRGIRGYEQLVLALVLVRVAGGHGYYYKWYV